MKNLVYKGEIIFVWLLIPVLAGIIAALSFPVLSLMALCLKMVWISMAILLTLWLGYKTFQIYLHRWLPGIVLYVFLFSLAIFITLNRTKNISPNYYAYLPARAFVATIVSEPTLSKGIMRCEANVEKVIQERGVREVVGKLLLVVKVDSSFDLRFGDQVLLPNRLTGIEPPYNPFEFNYRNYLSNLGIGRQVFIKPTQIRILAREKANPLTSYALKFRKHLVTGFNQYIQNKEAAALASTLILGYKAELSSSIITAYSKTGTMHVLSVSGMHVLLVFSVLTVALSFLDKSTGLKVVKVVLIISAVWFYALLTGFSTAVCRAAVMCSIYVVGKTFNRKTNSYNTLAASALLLLLYNPFFLTDTGFQLSYLAVLGLIYLYPKIRHLVYVRNKIVDTIWSWTAVSLAAQVTTFPLSLYYFHQFPLYFLVGNLFIILPVEFIMYAGIVFLVLFSFRSFVYEPLLALLGKMLNFSIGCLDRGLLYIEGFPHASLNFYPHGAVYYSCVFLVSLMLIYSVQVKHKKFLFISLSLLLVLTTYSAVLQYRNDQRRQIIFYSLKKNRAVGFFEGRTCFLFTDLQPSEKTYSYSIQPSLNALSKTVYRLKGHTGNNPTVLDGHFLQFHGWKIMVWDNFWRKKHFRSQLRVNAVLISDNPKLDLRNITRGVKFSLLLIDASNKDYQIKKWVQQARDLGVKCYVLKHHPALKIILNI